MRLRTLFATGVFALLASSPALAGISGASLVAFADSAPLSAAQAPGDGATLYVGQRDGTVRGLDLDTGAWHDSPLLEVAGVDTIGEGGLLGIAFHPGFATNQKLYVHATIDLGDANPGIHNSFDSRIIEYTLDPQGGAPAVRLILSVPQPTAFHNGGWIGFNPAAVAGEEGLLYLTLGDGDTPGTAQTTTNGDLLGKALRIDPTGDDFPEDDARNYAIPATNPFVAGPEDGEILAYGLRNPYRASFDRRNGDLWIGDVGDASREEIDVIRADSGGGQNFGWDPCEGGLSSEACNALKASTTVTDPVYDYARPGVGPVNFTGVSVAGGVVYRGPDPEVNGRYLFGDTFAPGSSFWSLDAADPAGSVVDIAPELFPAPEDRIGNPVGFAEDLSGNVYILTLGGGIFRIETDALIPGDYNRDGTVDAADYTVWRDHLNQNDSVLSGAGDGSGTVDAGDYTIWQNAYGNTAVTYQAQAAVPEPAALTLCLGAALLPLRTRSRRP